MTNKLAPDKLVQKCVGLFLALAMLFLSSFYYRLSFCYTLALHNFQVEARATLKQVKNTWASLDQIKVYTPTNELTLNRIRIWVLL